MASQFMIAYMTWPGMYHIHMVLGLNINYHCNLSLVYSYFFLNIYDLFLMIIEAYIKINILVNPQE